jgi:protocatechuate 3,4-dioxygenase beta subunit
MPHDREQRIILPNRREVIVKGAAGALAMAGLGWKNTVLAANTLKPTPGVTEGPYWVDDFLLRNDIRMDPTTGIVEAGFPLRLSVNVFQILSNSRTSPIKNAIVDIWHANAVGVYSDEASENTLVLKFLRGTQFSNASGQVQFLTVYPGWYSGRTPHIHIRVRLYNFNTGVVTYNFVTQCFFQDAVSNAIFASYYPYTLHPGRDTFNTTDSIYEGASEDNEVTSKVGSLLMPAFSRNMSYALASFNILIDTTDAGYNNGLGGSSNPSAGAGGTPPTGAPPAAP